MRIKSEKLLFLLGFFMIAGFFILGVKLAPTASFAEEDNEDAVYVNSGPDHFITVYDGESKKLLKLMPQQSRKS